MSAFRLRSARVSLSVSYRDCLIPTCPPPPVIASSLSKPVPSSVLARLRCWLVPCACFLPCEGATVTVYLTEPTTSPGVVLGRRCYSVTLLERTE
eukprot:scaffold52444_cov60-Phaeocystis_antarctica.AAC.2